MEVELGGKRLGNGQKMTVEIEGFGKSNHNLSKVIKTTMSPGTLIPIYKKLTTPGDDGTIKIRAKIQTNPTIGALYGSYIFGIDFFSIDMRLYIGGLQYNAQNLATNMQFMKIPQIRVAAKSGIPATDNSQVGSSCVLKYLGIKGVGSEGTGIGTQIAREFNAVPIIGYYDICRNYFANKQEENCYIIHTPAFNSGATSIGVSMNGLAIPEGSGAPQFIGQGTGGSISFSGNLNADNIRIITEQGEIPMRYLYETFTGGTSPFTFNNFLEARNILGYRYDITSQNEKPELKAIPLTDLEKIRPILNSVPVGSQYVIDYANLLSPWKELLSQSSGGYTSLLNSQEGLMVKTYQSDLLQNFIKTETIEALSAQTAVSTAGGVLNLDALNFGMKLNNLLQREAAAGGNLKDYIEVAYGVEMYAASQIPVYLGGYRDKIVFEEVVSNSATETQPLGQIAGKGRFLGQERGGTVEVKTREWGYIMAIAHITPEIDYSQGNTFDVNLKTVDNIHKPSLDKIGYQDLITEQMAYWDTIVSSTGITQKSMGKQPAWWNYHTDYNENYGLFAEEDNMMFMTLNRRYEKDEDDETIKDLTTYIDPAKFNYIFANTEISAQNFRVQIGLDYIERRVMSAKALPTL